MEATRVCLDLSPALHRRTGIGRYARELAEALVAATAARPARDYAVFLDGRPSRDPAELGPTLAGLPRHSTGLPTKPWRLAVAASQLAGLSLDRLVPGVRVFHATDHLLPRFSGVRSVLTVHDLAFLVHPEVHTRTNRWFLKAMVPIFARRADRVIAVSEATRRDVVRLLRVPESRVRVIPEGVDARFRPASAAAVEEVQTRYALPEGYLLYVGTVEPRKNLTTLLTALDLLRRQGHVRRLVVAGRVGWMAEGFFETRRRLGLEESVRLLGFVADADLPALLGGASAFVFPSLYEGFGLPVLEAMACGTPVVCADSSSLPEVAGGAALLVPPTDAEALAAAVDRATEDRAVADELRAAGLARAARLTWTDAARRTREVYDELR